MSELLVDDGLRQMVDEALQGTELQWGERSPAVTQEVDRGTERFNGSPVRYPLGWNLRMVNLVTENDPTLTD